MKTVSIREAKNRLTELARQVEAGETITVTRHGKPTFDLTPHKGASGVDFAAGRRFLREKGFNSAIAFIADDFDDPLAEDFLLQPLPGQP
ncbi:MAG: type II toxin-antitoxin system Phd/YefM family antitoxin [Alphaproteobacteria bacterium]|nr:type II toxin-antitoxin system Phd/YefM family antitoxin [Alphaproteobacteria bacterium]